MLCDASLRLTTSFAEGCPPYLDATAEDREACNLGSQEYLSGTWKRREEDCQVAEEEALKELAYPFTWICHENEWGESCAADAKDVQYPQKFAH